MKVKKTPEEISEIILSQLKTGPKTISEISDSVNSNWLTIEKFLKELKEKNLVLEIISSPKMKVYRRYDDLAFYGIPFSKEIRENTHALLCKIAKVWREKVDSPPLKTILQKIAVDLIEESNGEIELPTLHFHYGKTTAVRYEETFEEEGKIFHLTPNQNVLLLRLINEYKKMSSRKAKLFQYKKPGMEFYYIKEKEITEISLWKKSKGDLIKKLETALLKLSSYYPLELKETFKIFDRFIYCSINLLNVNKQEERMEYFKKIKEMFFLVWDAITTEYFLNDSEKWIEPNRRELFLQMKANILNSKLLNIVPRLEDLQSELESINPEDIGRSTSEKSKKLLHFLMEE